MIELKTEGLHWTVTLNRPDKANSLTHGMLTRIADLAEEAAAGGVRAFVLTGTGKVFSAGADLDEAKAGLATDPVWERLSSAIARIPGLTVAALNGTLAGGACGMALACDIRIGVPGAKFFYPAIRLGYLPQPSDPGRLAALIGPARAKMILMSGAKIEAEEALAWGLIDRIVPVEGLSAAVADLIEAPLAAKPEVLAGIKTLIG